ncbi:hypothetical protein C8J56DRAFT_170733 [Mycena floridula]|nr:hypothetical protein C8J56DRAFT_170733 [Mycena floridula]
MEILLIILEVLVEIVPEKAVELVTLSRGLHPFIEDLLYRTIHFATNAQVNSFVNLIMSGSKPLSFYQNRIRNICITSPATRLKDATSILSAGRAVDTLALLTIAPNRSDLQSDIDSFYSALTALHPKRLSVWFDRLDINSTLGLHWLHRLTHLQIFSPKMNSRSALEFNNNVLQHLPELTHLYYLSQLPSSTVSSFASSLRLSAKFVVCIVQVHIPEPAWISEHHDPRIVMLVWTIAERDLAGEKVPNYVLVRDLVNKSNSPRGRKTSSELDIWELAEEKVELQRRLRIF